MNNIISYILLLLFFSSCSFNSKSSFWTKEKKIKEQASYIKVYSFSESKNISIKEFNKDIKLKFDAKLLKKSFINNQDNNNGFIDYDGNLNKVSKYKYSKIKYFNKLEPDLIFHKKGLIFFDNKGAILNFDNNSKLIWKKNIYNKKEQKLNPILFFGSDENTLVITDSISNYYAINIEDGKLLWKRNHTSPFNSQIKVYNGKFYTIDFENVLNCVSLLDGEKIWNVKTEDSFVKSIKKLSLIIKNNMVIFNNSIGDISAVNIDTGDIIWQTPTQSSLIYAESFKLKISDIISESNSIYFSNNQNEFYSLDLESGLINWKQKVSSSLRPTVVENLVFTISQEGLFYVIEKNYGNIIRITDVFNNLKKKERNKTKAVGFIVGKKYIYLTNNNGKLFLIDIEDGKTKKILKIDSGKISRPLFVGDSLYIAKDDSIIKLK